MPGERAVSQLCVSFVIDITENCNPSSKCGELLQMLDLWQGKLHTWLILGIPGLSSFLRILSQMDEGLETNRFFRGFYPFFVPILPLDSLFMYMTRIFYKEIGPSLLFLAVQTNSIN